MVDAEAERREVERELAWIRQAMHSRLEYLEEAQGLGNAPLLLTSSTEPAASS